jgi:hypothetical protein
MEPSGTVEVVDGPKPGLKINPSAEYPGARMVNGSKLTLTVSGATSEK